MRHFVYYVVWYNWHMNQQDGFAVGDLVKLKSGGPLMTVEEGGESIGCTWFEGDKLQKGSFKPNCLTPMALFPSMEMKAVPLIR